MRMDRTTNKRMKTALGLAVLAMSAMVTGCLVTCENEPVSSVTSPSGRLRAVVFYRGCGATTGFNTQLSILPLDDTVPDDGGNAFIADGTVPLKLQWISDAELVVSGSQGSKPFKQERRLNGVEITYR